MRSASMITNGSEYFGGTVVEDDAISQRYAHKSHTFSWDHPARQLNHKNESGKTILILHFGKDSWGGPLPQPVL
jgi:hypothetical protein